MSTWRKVGEASLNHLGKQKILFSSDSSSSTKARLTGTVGLHWPRWTLEQSTPVPKFRRGSPDPNFGSEPGEVGSRLGESSLNAAEVSWCRASSREEQRLSGHVGILEIDGKWHTRSSHPRFKPLLIFDTTAKILVQALQHLRQRHQIRTSST